MPCIKENMLKIAVELQIKERVLGGETDSSDTADKDGAEALIKLEFIVACSSSCLCMTEDSGGTKARQETREGKMQDFINPSHNMMPS